MTEKDLENTDNLKNGLQNKLPNLDYEDWYDLLISVRCKKYQTEYENQTAEKILNEMQFPMKAASNEAVNQLLEAAAKGRLYGFDNGTKNSTTILWKIFYCCIMDIKDAIVMFNKTAKPVSNNDITHKRLMYFIEALRVKLWKRGEVLRLREIE